MTIRFELKAATDDLHRELDEKLSHLDLGNAQDYRRFLDFQARTVPSVESALAAAGLSELVDGWSDHRRGATIESDLRALGEVVPPPAPAPAIAGNAELLGTAYVVEGSRLGGRVLRRRVAEGMPMSFLGEDSLGSWNSLLAAMERFLISDSVLTEAKDAARRSFAWFLRIAHEARI